MTDGIRDNDRERSGLNRQGRDNWRDREQVRERAQESDALDRELDAALAKYAAVEPRVGLEERVLANLQAQNDHASSVVWWRWAAVGALAVAITLVLFVSWRTRKPQLVHVPNPVTKQDVSDNQVASNRVLPPRDVPSIRKSLANRTPHSIPVATAAPHLTRFPSPEAMSDQEKMLADYAAEFQEQAVLIARFHEEDLRRDRMELVEDAQNNPNRTRVDNEETKLR